MEIDYILYFVGLIVILALMYLTSFLMGYYGGEDLASEYNKEHKISYYLYFVPRKLGNEYKNHRMFNK